MSSWDGGRFLSFLKPSTSSLRLEGGGIERETASVAPQVRQPGLSNHCKVRLTESTSRHISSLGASLQKLDMRIRLYAGRIRMIAAERFKSSTVDIVCVHRVSVVSLGLFLSTLHGKPPVPGGGTGASKLPRRTSKTFQEVP